VPTATIASNLNFPAPLSVLGFLAAFAGLFLAVASVLIFWLARKPKFARISAIAAGAAAVVFFILRLSFSVASGETALAYGREKYFCEIDCHLAYSDLDAHTRPDGCFVITVRTRFDETATSRTRPKDAPLAPSPREARLIDSPGRPYAPVSSAGTPLRTPRRPAGSYTTQLEFNLPKECDRPAPPQSPRSRNGPTNWSSATKTAGSARKPTSPYQGAACGIPHDPALAEC
jgi:hypothetical protein